MTSHEYARKLRQTVEFLLGKADVPIDGEPLITFYFFGQKDLFLAAAKAFGSGHKSTDSNYLRFRPTGTILELVVNRDLVCRKVQDEKWECEPLLSQAEEATLVAKVPLPQMAEVNSDDIPF